MEQCPVLSDRSGRGLSRPPRRQGSFSPPPETHRLRNLRCDRSFPPPLTPQKNQNYFPFVCPLRSSLFSLSSAFMSEISPDSSARLLFSSNRFRKSVWRQSSMFLSTCSRSNPGLRESPVMSAESSPASLRRDFRVNVLRSDFIFLNNDRMVSSLRSSVSIRESIYSAFSGNAIIALRRRYSSLCCCAFIRPNPSRTWDRTFFFICFSSLLRPDSVILVFSASSRNNSSAIIISPVPDIIVRISLAASILSPFEVFRRIAVIDGVPAS